MKKRYRSTRPSHYYARQLDEHEPMMTYSEEESWWEIIGSALILMIIGASVCMIVYGIAAGAMS